MYNSPKISMKTINLEIVRGCNFRCKMCPTSRTLSGPMQHMSRETAQIVVERMEEVDTVGAIWTIGFGETLAHPDCYRIFEILNRMKRQKDTPVVMNTNASCLLGESAYAILEIPFITQLYISFDGYGTKESFEYMRGAHFYEVIDNVRNFMILAKRKRPGLYVGTCSIYPEAELIPENVRGGGTAVSPAEAERALKGIFEPMGVHVGMRRLHNYNGAYELEIFKGNKSFVPPAREVYGGCSCLEESNIGFLIAPDGKVRPCCAALDEDFVVGNLHRQSFSEILSGPQFLDLRHKLRLDQRNSYKECIHCGGSFDTREEAAAYWRKRLAAGEVTDPNEISYLSSLAEGEKR